MEWQCDKSIAALIIDEQLFVSRTVSVSVNGIPACDSLDNKEYILVKLRV